MRDIRLLVRRRFTPATSPLGRAPPARTVLHRCRPLALSQRAIRGSRLTEGGVDSLDPPGSEDVMIRLRRCIPVVLALAMPLALLAGCSFGTAPLPGGYHCTKPQHPAGCATAIDFTHSHINPDSNPDIAGDPVYAYSDLLVVPLTCDAACQASSGGGNPPGFIYNFMSMVQLPAGYYIEAGYTTTTPTARSTSCPASTTGSSPTWTWVRRRRATGAIRSTTNMRISPWASRRNRPSSDPRVTGW